MIRKPPCPAIGFANAHFVEGHGTGFTLIELLIVIVLIGLLLTIAVPQYQKFIQRGYRVEAITMLTEAAACQERIRADNGAYDSDRCTRAGHENQHYQILSRPAADNSVDGFILSAIPVITSDQDTCGSLGLDHTGRRTITGPAGNLWACWSGR
jgi:type IV pilus assembly protein PilE